MHLEPGPEEKQFAQTVERFLAQRYSFEARKRILASPEGWSREVWEEMAGLGLLALQVPEAHGGMAPATVETMLALGAMGRALVLEPFVSSAVLGTAVLRALGSPAQQAAELPAMAEGKRVVVPACFERGGRWELARVETSAARAGGGWALRGRKAVAQHAPCADALLVSARTAGGEAEEAGVSVFLVPRGAPGLTLAPCRTLDGQPAADVLLEGVQVPADALVGPEGGALPALSAAFDLGVAALCAEAVGALQAALDATVEYTRTRKQFGVPIGKFQALQHRMAEMLIHVEQARSMSTLAALRAASPDARARRTAVSAAKVLVGQACRAVGQQAVQLHGGMGVTDELPVSHLFKKLTTLEHALGDGDLHLERFVAEGGRGAG